MTVIELFAGAGGAAIGLHRAGFEHLALCEWDRDACATLRAADLGPVIEGDVRAVDWSPYAGRCDALWASPPCQAWSSAGKRLGALDERNGWPWTFAACAAIGPTWLVCENVPGLTHHRSDDGDLPSPEACPGCYFEGVILPEAQRRFAHVSVLRLDAADYGVPQRRHRVFMVCGPAPVAAPAPTHSEAALTFAKWRTGDYWRRHGIAPVGEPSKADRKILGAMFAPGAGLLPWRTVRDALDLSGRIESGSKCRRGTDGEPRGALIIGTDRPSLSVDGTPHAHREGPRAGRPGGGLAMSGGDRPELLDAPSPSVTAQEVKGTRASAASGGTFHGGPDRAADVAFAGAGLRRLTTAECATLQDFPPDHPWRGTKTAIYRQIGNAVPPTLAEVVARAILGAAS